MKSSYFIGLAIMFVVFTLISGICEADFAKGTESVTLLQQLVQPPMVDSSTFIGAIASYVNIGWDYVSILWKMFWFDYSFFTGGAEWFRYVFFIPISIGLVLTLVLSVLRGVGSN